MTNLRAYHISVGCHNDWLRIAVYAESTSDAFRAARRVLGVPLEFWDIPPGQDTIRARIANDRGRYCTAYCPDDCPGPGSSDPIPLAPKPEQDCDSEYLLTSRQLQELRRRHRNADNSKQRQELADRIRATAVPPWADFNVIDAMISRFIWDSKTPDETAAALRYSADLLESHARQATKAPAAQRPEQLEKLVAAVSKAQAMAQAPGLPDIGRRMELMYDEIGHAARQWAAELRCFPPVVGKQRPR